MSLAHFVRALADINYTGKPYGLWRRCSWSNWQVCIKWQQVGDSGGCKGREAEHLVSAAPQRLNLKGKSTRVAGKCRPAKRPDATAKQARVIGALLLGLDGSNRRPRKRWASDRTHD